MNHYEASGRWWTLVGWTAAGIALGAAALAAEVTPLTLTLVGLFGALMVLVQLRWQSAALQAAEERERTLALLRETLETTADGFLLLDLEGHVLSFNQKLVEMSGLPASHFAEGKFDELTSWMMDRVEDPRGFLRRLKELTADEEVEARDEFRFRDGRIFERYTRPHLIRGRIEGRAWSFRDVTAERRALGEIAERDAILEAVSFAAERFLRPGDWLRGLDAALALIGAAAGASRAYLFANTTAPDGTVRVSRRAEWTADGVSPALPQVDLQGVPLAELGLQCWEDALRRNQTVHHLVRELVQPGRGCLEAQGARSILLIPIFIGTSWWGFLGFDDCTHERQWSQTVRDALMAAGRMIAAGIQRKQAEEALRESEMRFKQLAENIPEVFLMAPMDVSEILYLSPSFETMWGRSMAEAYADPGVIPESIVPADRPLFFAAIEQSRDRPGDAVPSVDYRIQRPDGVIRWVRWRVFQIRDASGTPYRIAGVATDVTDQKQVEEELRRANRLEAIGHLAAGIAHEINTPIQYVGDNLRFLDDIHLDIRMAVDALRGVLADATAGTLSAGRLHAATAVVERAELDYLLAEAPRASAQALEGVHRVAEIVRAMKEFSHPGSGLKVPLDLNRAIRSTATVARNEWKYIAELEMHFDESLPPVLCLAGELNQAILNLVINAAHSIADRQRAEGGEQPGRITISTANLGEVVEIRVRDTGTGIPAEIRARIFDPFFTTKEVGRGTGQGLTFVHSIVVEKHGGTISFDTEMGVGTTFIVRLPNGQEAPPIEVAA